MTKRTTGGPAFPTEAYDIERQFMVREEGMTLRDYFAAKVLATACEDYNAREAAELAYRYADAMLAAREAA